MSNAVVVFDPLKRFLSTSAISVENVVFRFNSKGSVYLFLLFATLVGYVKHFGEPIACRARSTRKDLRQQMVTTYCWIYGTYTHEEIHQTQAHPGVGPQKENNEETRVYHTYYQWVLMVLLIQAAISYIPSFLWKSYEGGRIERAVTGLSQPELDLQKLVDRRTHLLKHWKNFHNKQYYTNIYIFCEVSNLLTVILQVVVTNRFVGGRFLDYGYDFLKHVLSGQHDDVHPLHGVFPHITKCDFSVFSKGGDEVEYDILCILSLNVINSKIYLVMWLWFIFLLAANIVNLAYRVFTFLYPDIKKLIFHWGFMSDVNKQCIDDVIDQLGYGEWFVLRLIYRNVDVDTFNEFIRHLSGVNFGKQEDVSVSQSEDV